MNAVNILLVEDELDIRDLIKAQLKALGHNVLCATDGTVAMEFIKDNQFDLFVLDRMLPGINGLEICKYLRSNQAFKETPILMVTALTDPEQIVEGLDAGADDYITKPFDLNVLAARVRSVLRRGPGESSEKFSTDFMNFGPFRIEVSNRRFYIEEKEVHLTKSEFEIMVTLLNSVGKVLSRKELKYIVQGDEVHVTDRTIDTHIFGLRKKLGNKSVLIESVRGIGYRLNEK
jgi:DNA-binding response OmpR family regulator